jgi:hypothetical protein
MLGNFKLDRSAFSALTLEEADKEMRQHKHLSVKERFEIMHYLNSIAFNYPLSDPPKMLKIFSGARRLQDE